MSKIDLYQLLENPIETEKTTLLKEKNIYIFKVLKSANKLQIKKSIELVFNVKVADVKTMITKGKIKMFRGKAGKRADYKKALVKLEDGQNIDFNLGA